MARICVRMGSSFSLAPNTEVASSQAYAWPSSKDKGDRGDAGLVHGSVMAPKTQTRSVMRTKHNLTDLVTEQYVGRLCEPVNVNYMCSDTGL